MGVWLVLFLFVHLLTNSQAALFVGDDGKGFIYDVELIHSLPYLKAIELFFLAIPFAVHMIWGVKYLFTGKSNALPNGGEHPYISHGGNWRYTLQRATAWLLLIGVLAHVVQMRFVNYPTSYEIGSQHFYLTKLSFDRGLYSLAARLGVLIKTSDEVNSLPPPPLPTQSLSQLIDTDQATQRAILDSQRQEEQIRAYEVIKAESVGEGECLAVCPNFGTATLLMVRDTFKSIWMAMLYTIFVVATCFHAFNGLWTAAITWGVTLSPASQRSLLRGAVALMCFVGFLGCAAIWGTYWINLRY